MPPPSVGRHADLVFARRAELAHAPRVLVVRQLLSLPESFHCGLIASAEHADQVYRIEPFSTASVTTILPRCHDDAPRLLLIDLSLLRDADPRDVYHLRTRLPATDWVIVGDGPSQAEDIAPYGWARGLIDWSADAATLTRALDAVLGGHLWFPRELVESLYLALLGSRWPGDAAPPPAAPAPASTQPLTTREAEVLALMRKGLSNKQIAERLEISINTVKKHLLHAFEKRGIARRRQAL